MARTGWIVAGVVGAAVALVAAGLVTRVRSLGDPLLLPLQSALMPAREDAERTRLLEDQLARLAAENALLRSRIGQYDRIAGEGGLPPMQAVVVRARVVTRTVRAARRYVELDVGVSDGVAVGMAVCDGWTLVGTVVGIQDGRCLVQELGDGESRIPSAILGADGVLAEGVCAGSGTSAEFRIDQIEDREGLQIRSGMPVVTAGGDGRFPAGMSIGTVRGASRLPGDDHWRITVRPRSGTWAESLLVVRFAEPAAPPPAEPAATP